MVELLALLSAALIAVMIAVNGRLTDACGAYLAAVFIHIIGLIAVSAAVAVKRQKLRPDMRLPVTAFFGGAIGVATTLFNNFAYGHISVSSIVALTLLGQSLCALLIDRFGWFGLPVRPFYARQIPGLLCTAAGVAVLLFGGGGGFSVLPVLFSLLAGVSIVVSRCINASLGRHTSPLVSCWYNYAVGLLVILPVFGVALLLGHTPTFSIAAAPPAWSFLGGVIGVGVVVLFNICTPRLAAFRMTLLLFVGQVFTGVLVDIVLSGAFSWQNLLGGVLVAFGLALNALLERRKAA